MSFILPTLRINFFNEGKLPKKNSNGYKRDKLLFYFSLLVHNRYSDNKFYTKMANFTISNDKLAEIAIASGRDVNKCVEVIKSNHTDLSEIMLVKISEHLIKTFFPKFTKKWNEAARNKKFFFAKNEKWLSVKFTVLNEDIAAGSSKRSHSGRPEKPIDECCDRAKRYKVKKLCETVQPELIAAAAKRISDQSTRCEAFSAEKAWALMLDASLTRHQYEILRKAAKEIGCDIFPAYHNVLNAKKDCYPPHIDATESYAYVGLQELLDHTVKRIYKTKTDDELASMSEEVTLLSKWGCDGSSGHTEYKQSFVEDGATDTNIFLTTLVPLRLNNKINNSLVYWKNETPSSTRYCRPVQFQFMKETTDVSKNEISRMESEIANLNQTTISMNNRIFRVTHELHLTMIDGKIAQTITDTSSNAVCYICKAKPTEMNKLEHLKTKEVNTDAFKVGLSPLHARLKFMECILHIAYNKSFKSWRTNANTLPLKEEEKKKIQDELFKRLGIKVDFVKQGMGSSNDGNTSRRFFDNVDIVAEITGVDERLIHRFSIILQTINSGASVDSEKFGKYCEETTRLYVGLYDWYYMPNTVHKVLMHGSHIISAAALPVGMLSEEAQEARNKDYRRYRLNHSRKCSRELTNEDVFHMLLASSDPYTNSLRAMRSPKHLPLHEDVKALLHGGNEE